MTLELTALQAPADAAIARSEFAEANVLLIGSLEGLRDRFNLCLELITAFRADYLGHRNDGGTS